MKTETINGKQYQPVEFTDESSCSMCAFDDSGWHCSLGVLGSTGTSCMGSFRDDGKDVYFIEIDHSSTQTTGKEKMKSNINEIIDHMFNAEQWGIKDTIEAKRAQLHKNLTDQINGWWSGHTAYQIMTNGGFLVDGKSCTMKKLTKLGEIFMQEMGEPKHNRVNAAANKND